MSLNPLIVDDLHRFGLHRFGLRRFDFRRLSNFWNRGYSRLVGWSERYHRFVSSWRYHGLNSFLWCWVALWVAL